MDFHLQRRQQFLNEKYFVFYRDLLTQSIGYWKDNLPANAGSEISGRVLAFSIAAKAAADLFLLRYTAGESLDVLRDDLPAVLEVYEQLAGYTRAEYQSDAAPPLLLDEREDYQRLIQLIGLCILLHRSDLLPSIAAMFDGTNAGDDALYEDMLSYYAEDRFDVDDLLHHKPYHHLLDAIRGESAKNVRDVEKYVKAWYLAMSDLTWHDSHLDLSENGPGYHGYWAIEAGAVAYLLDIDDRTLRENIVYPKDLVDYARALDRSAPAAPAPNTQLRVAGSDACPQEGYWMTPAAPDSRRFFRVGDIMPVIEGSAYGATIWQWSEEQ